MVRPQYGHRNFHSNKTRNDNYVLSLLSSRTYVTLDKTCASSKTLEIWDYYNSDYDEYCLCVCHAMQSDGLSLVSYPDCLGLQILLKNEQISPMLQCHNLIQYSYKPSVLAITWSTCFNQYDIPTCKCDHFIWQHSAGVYDDRHLSLKL